MTVWFVSRDSAARSVGADEVADALVAKWGTGMSTLLGREDYLRVAREQPELLKSVGLGTAADHHVHHKTFVYNYGHTMMWWDRLAGTYKSPDDVRSFNKLKP